MSAATVLFFALLLDAALGEPKWLWDRYSHPAVIMGRCVSALDRKLNSGKHKVLSGLAALVVLTGGAYMIGWGLSVLGGLIEIIVVAVLLAQRSLVEHVAAVGNGLRQSLGEGRQAVSMIVSRTTDQLDESAVARSAIESAAENLSDGVIAPALWFLIGGLPALLLYKIVNTADSMIAYRTPKYEKFGKATAYLDDAMNLIPARLTCALIAVPSGVGHAWRAIAADARKHRSPNAGWPEAAMSRAIGVALAGPRAYDGKMQDFPWVGAGGKRDLGPQDIDAALRQLWRAWGTMLGLVLLLALLG